MNLPLAASDFDIVVGIFVFIIWVIASIAGKLKTAMNPKPGRSPNEPTPLQRMQQQIAEQIRQMQDRTVVRPPPLPTQRRQPPRQQRQRPQPAPPPVQPAAKPAPAVMATPHPTPQTVQAPTIRRWLTPTTLRQQFILTELFQAPLSMREGR